MERYKKEYIEWVTANKRDKTANLRAYVQKHAYALNSMHQTEKEYGMDLSELPIEAIKEFYQSQTDISCKTLEQRNWIFRQYTKFCQDNFANTTTNPYDSITLSTLQEWVEENQQEKFTEMDFRKTLAVLQFAYDKLIAIAIFNGMSIQELSIMQWSDIDGNRIRCASREFQMTTEMYQYALDSAVCYKNQCGDPTDDYVIKKLGKKGNSEKVDARRRIISRRLAAIKKANPLMTYANMRQCGICSFILQYIPRDIALNDFPLEIKEKTEIQFNQQFVRPELIKIVEKYS